VALVGVRIRQINVVEFRVEIGLPVDAIAARNYRPALGCLRRARMDIVKLLLARKAPVDLKDGRHHATPLAGSSRMTGDPPAGAKPDHCYEVMRVWLPQSALDLAVAGQTPTIGASCLKNCAPDPPHGYGSWQRTAPLDDAHAGVYIAAATVSLTHGHEALIKLCRGEDWPEYD